MVYVDPSQTDYSNTGQLQPAPVKAPPMGRGLLAGGPSPAMGPLPTGKLRPGMGQPGRMAPVSPRVDLRQLAQQQALGSMAGAAPVQRQIGPGGGYFPFQAHQGYLLPVNPA